MALERTALRLALVEALKADSVIAALCATRIYDSRINQLSASEPVPLIVITTEDQAGPAWSVNNGGPPFNTKCDLVLEISLRFTVPIDGSDEIDIGITETDAEMEMTLDLLEHRAVEAVAIADTPQSRLVRNTVLRRVSELKSSRFVSDETGAKLAVRLVTLTAELKGSDPAADLAATGPFASIPDPLRSVCAGLDPQSSGYAACVALAAQITSPTPIIFTGADVTLVASNEFDPVNPPVSGDTNAADPIIVKVDP